MKKIIYCLLASIVFSLTACEIDEKKPDSVNVAIGYDDDYAYPGAYIYPNSAATVDVVFFVTGASTAEVILQDGTGKKVKTQTITPGTDGKCVVTYTHSELGIADPKEQMALCIVNAGGLTKSFPIQLDPKK